MKKLLLSVLLILSQFNGFSQTLLEIDSLKHELVNAKDDTSRVLILANLSFKCLFVDFDAYKKYSQEGLALAQKIKFIRGEVSMLNSISYEYQIQGEMPRALEISFGALQKAEEKHYPYEIALCYTSIGSAYWFLEDY